MRWRDYVGKAIYLACCAVFGYDPESQSALSHFIPAYTDDVNTPQAPRNVDVCYFDVQTFQGQSNFDYIMERQVTRNSIAKTGIVKTIPCSVLLTFYGPNADEDAEDFWSLFQWDNGGNSPRAILRQMKIAPIGKPDRPISTIEVEGTYQRRRSDVRVNLAYLVEKEYDSSHVDTVPDIGIQHQQ